MARRLQEVPQQEQHEEQQPDDATRQHNIGNRRTVLQQCCAEIDRLETEAASLREKVKGVNKQIGDTYRRIKSELGISRENAELVRRIVALEDEERDEALDQVKEVYEALRPGEQLDFFKPPESQREAAPAANGADGAHAPA